MHVSIAVDHNYQESVDQQVPKSGKFRCGDVDAKRKEQRRTTAELHVQLGTQVDM